MPVPASSSAPLFIACRQPGTVASTRREPVCLPSCVGSQTHNFPIKISLTTSFHNDCSLSYLPLGNLGHHPLSLGLSSYTYFAWVLPSPLGCEAFLQRQQVVSHFVSSEHMLHRATLPNTHFLFGPMDHCTPLSQKLCLDVQPDPGYLCNWEMLSGGTLWWLRWGVTLVLCGSTGARAVFEVFQELLNQLLHTQPPAEPERKGGE